MPEDKRIIHSDLAKLDATTDEDIACQIAEDPEKLTAKLAIHLLDYRLKHPWKALFQFGPSRTRIEQAAKVVFGNDEVEIEPYVAYAVEMIVQHFEKNQRNEGLPAEQEVICWMRERGGIPALLLAYLASTTPAHYKPVLNTMSPPCGKLYSRLRLAFRR